MKNYSSLQQGPMREHQIQQDDEGAQITVPPIEYTFGQQEPPLPTVQEDQNQQPLVRRLGRSAMSTPPSIYEEPMAELPIPRRPSRPLSLPPQPLSRREQRQLRKEVALLEKRDALQHKLDARTSPEPEKITPAKQREAAGQTVDRAWQRWEKEHSPDALQQLITAAETSTMLGGTIHNERARLYTAYGLRGLNQDQIEQRLASLEPELHNRQAAAQLADHTVVVRPPVQNQSPAQSAYDRIRGQQLYHQPVGDEDIRAVIAGYQQTGKYTNEHISALMQRLVGEERWRLYLARPRR